MPEKEFAHGLVIGKFYPFHVGHAALIRAAIRRSDRVTVQVLGASVESVSLADRVGWIREEHPTVDVASALDDAPVDFASEAAWREHMAVIEGLLTTPVDAVFTSDEYGGEFARRLGAAWVQVDPGRRATPVSGRAIRADLRGQWHELPAGVRAGLARRVVVLGAESTGSTTLAGSLAEALGTAWIPEYGREYSLVRTGGMDAPWHTLEFDLIVDRQIQMERDAARTVPTPILVCDTDVLATALWHERYLEAPAPHLLARAAAHPPALYLLTGDEIPFVQDGTRDGEHIRAGMQERFRETLRAQPVPWLEVRGDRDARLAAARAAVTRVVEPELGFALPLEQRPWDEQVALQARSGRE